GQYHYLYDFLQDCHLIWENCRNYNGPDNVYYQYANECESFMSKKMIKIQSLELTPEIWEKIIANDFQHDARFSNVPISLEEMQMLASRLDRLEEPAL
ncbi:hypothetical protein KIPB_011623, partial [Kipferlia bialata]